MDNLLIAGTDTTPSVLFFIEKGILTFSGKSLPENVERFYKQINEALDLFIYEHSHNSLVITCEFEYINTSSSKAVFNLLKKAIKSLENVMIVWGYEEEDEDMFEQGQDFASALGVKFEYRIFAA